MPNFAVTEYSTGEKDSLDATCAALCTRLETVDDTKTLRMLKIKSLQRDREKCIGDVIYDT
jgi:hypothetical protein